MGANACWEHETKLRRILEQLLLGDAVALRPALTHAARVIADVLDAERVAILLYPPSTPLTHPAKRNGDSSQQGAGTAGWPGDDDMNISIVQRGQGRADDAELTPGRASDPERLALYSSQFDVAGERRGIVHVLSDHGDCCQPGDDPAGLAAVARWIGIIVRRVEYFESLTQQAFETGRQQGFSSMFETLTRHKGKSASGRWLN